jgi:hypothetical protein
LNVNAAAFGKQFGVFGRGLATLISMKSATFGLWTKTAGQGGLAAFTSPDGRNMNVNLTQFPGPHGGIPNMSATEAFVHETGHMVASLFPGYADAINVRSALKGDPLPRRGQ